MKMHTYLNFAGNTQEAFEFYRSVFGGEIMGPMRFRDMGGEEMKVPEKDLDKVMHIALPVGDGVLMGTDTLESIGQKLEVGNNTWIVLEPDSREEAQRIFEKLSEGGRVEMPLQKVDWAELYGHFVDRFGIQWMISYTGEAAHS